MYWWHNHVCPESSLQKLSNRYQQLFKVTVAYVFKKTVWIRQVTTSIFSTQVYDTLKLLHDLIWKSAISTNPIYGRQTSAHQSVIELSMCSCKKTNCDSLRCNMCQCLNCSNIEFYKPEFKWEITSVYADELSAAQTLLIEEGFFIASYID